MEKLTPKTENILIERFGKDSIIALATADGNKPFVRNVDAFYEDGAFYVLTYALSSKINQIQKNPDVAISGDWFTASGKGINLGFFGKKENQTLLFSKNIEISFHGFAFAPSKSTKRKIFVTHRIKHRFCKVVDSIFFEELYRSHHG